MAKGGSEPVEAGQEGQEVAGEYRRAVHMGTADPDRADTHKLEARGEPGAWRRARPVRRAGRGNGPRDNLGTAPRPDPYKKALGSIMAKVRALTSRSRHKTLTDLLRQLNWTLRGWCNFFRHGVSAATFRYLDLFAWRRVTLWLRKRHLGINWKALYRRFLTGRPGHRPAEGKAVLFQCQKVAVTRYRWRADNIPTPWASVPATTA